MDSICIAKEGKRELKATLTYLWLSRSRNLTLSTTFINFLQTHTHKKGNTFIFTSEPINTHRKSQTEKKKPELTFPTSTKLVCFALPDKMPRNSCHESHP